MIQNLQAPLQMRQARKEVLRALASSDPCQADRHCKRAAELMNTALDEIHSHPSAYFDWSELKADHN
ncbi:hypothetical protein GCM10023208_26770 [Erythrobacter westpacificensis]|uniref:Uncharacterized protein n=1 Tax=Erythrobacter westpacificensis TaxID=1055231 RepID=A0ABP9KLM4_9SPHN